MKPDVIDSLVDNGYKGIVIAGTGLGHKQTGVSSLASRCGCWCPHLHDGPDLVGIYPDVCL